jgi:hypothetical protein
MTRTLANIRQCSLPGCRAGAKKAGADNVVRKTAEREEQSAEKME